MQYGGWGKHKMYDASVTEEKYHPRLTTAAVEAARLIGRQDTISTAARVHESVTKMGAARTTLPKLFPLRWCILSDSHIVKPLFWRF